MSDSIHSQSDQEENDRSVDLHLDNIDYDENQPKSALRSCILEELNEPKINNLFESQLSKDLQSSSDTNQSDEEEKKDEKIDEELKFENAMA